MTLRLRMIVAFGVLALVTATLYGSLTFVVYQRNQWAQLEGLLNRELGRMQGALANPVVGVPLVNPERSGTVVQLVTADGRVVLPRDASGRLPAADEQQVVEFEGRQYLSAMRSLNGESTLRIGLDVTGEVRSRTDLARQLIWLGALISLLAAFLGGLVARGALSPLASLARQARGVDPSDPGIVEYRGPADEVAEVASALNAALSNIRERRAEERAFMAEVAHELAAPLTLVKGHLDAYLRDDPRAGLRNERDHLGVQDLADKSAFGSPSDNGAVEISTGGSSAGGSHLQAAREAAQELLLTSQDLLALARGELERRVQNDVLHVDELLDRVHRAYPDIQLDAAQGVRVVGDRHMLLQAIRNLVRNAIQASGGSQGVRVELEEFEQYVELRVRDRGPGIAPDRVERIFERYFSGSRGAGVGLTVVSRVVEQHGGELRVETGSCGSCFTVTLPSFAAQLSIAP
ncbi:MAG: HAMP domain-containing sensor histidine kinase [Trueperaceae bacterium]